MSTATIPRQAATPVARITRVVKLNLANPMTTIGLPWLILGSIFVLTLAIWVLVRANTPAADQADVSEGFQYSGASFWIFVYMMVVAVQAMNLTFPLALGYGSTRRDFYLGSALTFVLLSVMWAVGLTLLAVIEKATGGWGLGGQMFTALYFGGVEVPVWERFVIFLCGMLFFFFVGAAVAAIYVRWKAFGLTLFFIGLGAALVATVALITWAGIWQAVGQFLAGAQALGVSLWLLVPTAIAGLAGYLVLRRATPR
jgi:hypothetical protein